MPWWLLMSVALARPGEPPKDAPTPPPPPPLCDGVRATLDWLAGDADAPPDRAWAGALQCHTEARRVLGRFVSGPDASVVCDFVAQQERPLPALHALLDPCLDDFSGSAPSNGTPSATWTHAARHLRVDAVLDGEKVQVTARRTR